MGSGSVRASPVNRPIVSDSPGSTSARAKWLARGPSRRSKISTRGPSALISLTSRRTSCARLARSGANAGRLDRICVEESARRVGARKCTSWSRSGENWPVEVLDRGLMVRFTPYEGGRWFFRRGAMPEHGNVRFDVAYGLGIQNQPDEQVVFPIDPGDPGDPIARFTHHGIALRASRSMAEEFRDTDLGWVVGPHSEYWS